MTSSAKLRGVIVQFTAKCSSCANPLPINGMVEAVKCTRCANTIQLGADWWTSKLGSEELKDALACEYGHAETRMELGSGLQYAYGNRMPRCQKCKGEDYPADQFEAEADTGDIYCPQWGPHGNPSRQ